MLRSAPGERVGLGEACWLAEPANTPIVEQALAEVANVPMALVFER